MNAEPSVEAPDQVAAPDPSGPHPPTSSSGRVTWRSPLLWAAGTHYEWLTNGADRARLSTAGGIVILTALSAGSMLVFSLAIIAEPYKPTYLIAGVVWGLFIFQIDRWIVSTIDYGPLEPGEQQRTKRAKTAFFTGRLIISILIGILIAEPVVLWVFSSEIEPEIAQIHSEEIATLSDSVPLEGQFAVRESAIRSSLQAAQTVKDVADAAAGLAYSTWQDELLGTGGTNDPGDGPEAEALEAEYDTARINQTAAVTAVAEANRVAAIDRNDLVADVQDEIVDREEIIKENRGLLMREEALGRVLADNLKLQIARWVLAAALMMVDLMPLLLKTMSPRSVYERAARLDAMTRFYGKERRIKVDADKKLLDDEDALSARKHEHALADFERSVETAVSGDDVRIRVRASAVAADAVVDGIQQASVDDVEGLVHQHLADATETLQRFRHRRQQGDSTYAPPHTEHASVFDRGSSTEEDPNTWDVGDRMRNAGSEASWTGHQEGPHSADQQHASNDASRVVAKRWRLGTPLGPPGMSSIVYRAVDETDELDHEVAVKLYRDVVGLNDENERAARADAYSIPEGKVDENLAEILARGTDYQDLYVVTKLFPEVLHEHHAKLVQTETLTLMDTVRYARQIFRGLTAAWTLPTPRAHLDIKPQNIGVDHDGALKIFDWGLSKEIGNFDQAFATKSSTVYTEFYAPPEQAQRTKGVWGYGMSLRDADLRAWAACWYFMIIGAPPHHREARERNLIEDNGTGPNRDAIVELTREAPKPIRADIPDVPQILDASLQRWLAADPRDRNSGPDSHYVRRIVGMLEEIERAIELEGVRDLRVGWVSQSSSSNPTAEVALQPGETDAETLSGGRSEASEASTLRRATEDLPTERLWTNEDLR